MGKRKNKNTQTQTQTQSQAQQQNQAEEGNAEKKNTQASDGVIVMGINMHCEGCAKKVVKSLRGFAGVEEIETDMKNQKVTVKGKKADPKKVFERLRKKSGRNVVLISPVLKEGKKEEKKEDKKEQPKVVEVVLKVYMHCEGCAQDIKHCIHKLQGVHTVETEMAKSLVTVKGVFEPQKLVKYITKKAQKHAEIVKQTPPPPPTPAEKKKKEEEDDQKPKDDEKNKEGEPKKLPPYPNFDPQLVYAPQLFSDENPNSCIIM